MTRAESKGCLRTLALQALVFLGILGLIEIGIRLVTPTPFALWSFLVQPDPVVGFATKPNLDVIVDHGGDWGKIHYTTDAFGRRTTVNGNIATGLFAAFFGCSFEFGAGVNDDQTIPSQFAAAQSLYTVYNYGVGGAGAQHMLAKMPGLRNQMPERSGLGIYMFKGFHIGRTAGMMPDVVLWSRSLPAYELEGGALLYKGSFEKAYPGRLLLYDTLYASALLRGIGFNLPLWYRDRDFELVAAEIAEGKQRFMEQFAASRFVVVIWCPERTIEDYLTKAGVEYIEMSDLFNLDDLKKMKLPDGHPNAAADALIGKALAAKLLH